MQNVTEGLCVLYKRTVLLHNTFNGNIEWPKKYFDQSGSWFQSHIVLTLGGWEHEANTGQFSWLLWDLGIFRRNSHEAFWTPEGQSLTRS